MSDALQWQLLRKNSAFLVKRDGVQFSREKVNVMNVHSFKFSGLANSKAVGVNIETDAKGNEQIVLTQKRTKSSIRNKPARFFEKKTLKRHMGGKRCIGASNIRKATQKSNYRPDLANYAVARYYALRKALSLKKKASK